MMRCLMLLSLLVGFCTSSLFCYAVLGVIGSFANIWMCVCERERERERKRERERQREIES